MPRRVPEVDGPAEARAPFVPLRHSAVLAKGALVAEIATYAAAMLAGLAQYGLRDRAEARGFFTDGEARADDYLDLVPAVQGVVFVAVAIFFVAWLRYAYRNLTALGADGLRFRSWWTIGGWLVPIWWWFRPKQIADYVWRVSDPDLPARHSTSWRADAFRPSSTGGGQRGSRATSSTASSGISQAAGTRARAWPGSARARSSTPSPTGSASSQGSSPWRSSRPRRGGRRRARRSSASQNVPAVSTPKPPRQSSGCRDRAGFSLARAPRPSPPPARPSCSSWAGLPGSRRPHPRRRSRAGRPARGRWEHDPLGRLLRPGDRLAGPR